LRLVITFCVFAAGLALLGCSREDGGRVRPLDAQEARGERLYRTGCAACHRPNSTDPLNGPGLRGMYKKPYLPSGAPTNDERVHDVIKRGRRMMPGFGHIYDDRQIADIIAYLKTL
jgi:mono/diheme cytochrome c family protein